MNKDSKTVNKWEKFFRKNPKLTGSEADPKICANLLSNQEKFEKETIIDIAKKNFKSNRKQKK